MLHDRSPGLGSPKNDVYSSPDYLDWIRSLPCLVCHREGCHAHHNGHSSRNDYLAVPLCPDHHVLGGDSYHRMGHKSFENKHGIDLTSAIIRLLSQYIERRK